MFSLRAPSRRLAHGALVLALSVTLVAAGTTSAQAAEPAARPTYLAVDPVRVASGVQLAAGATTTITLPTVPSGATTVALNVTGTKASAPTSLEVCAGTSTTASCVDASVVAGDGLAAPAFTLATLGGAAGDQVTVVNGAAPVTLYADLEGFVVPSAAPDAPGSSLVARPATRVLANQKLGARAQHVLALPDVPAGATAVALNVSAAGATAGTYVSACPASQSAAACAKVSTLNPAPGADRQNFVVVALTPATPRSVQLYNNAGTVAVSVDVQGYLVAGGPSGSLGRLEPVAVAPSAPAAALSPSAPRTLTLDDAPRGATAVVLGVTATGANAAGTVAACPGPAGAAGTCATTSTLRTSAGATAANVALVPLGGEASNQVTLYSSGTATVGATVRGWVVPDPRRPDATNTGVPAGRALTVHRGDLTIKTPGTVIDSLDVYGVVVVRADNVVIKNTRIRGRSATFYTALVNNNQGARNLVIQDSELAADVESPYLYGILGAQFTAERVQIHRVIDAVHVTGPNVTVRASYLHDLSHFDADPNFGGTPSHDDNVQIQAGSNIRIVGNTVEGSWNAGVQITQDAGVVRDVQITDNWLDGGMCTINVAEKGRGPISGLVVTSNTFGRATRVNDCAVVAPTTTVLTQADNYFVDGAAIRVRKG